MADDAISSAIHSALDPFRLDTELFSKYLIERYEEPFGFCAHDERGFASAVRSRFDDAVDAQAVGGPAGIQPIVYPVGADDLILALRDSEFSTPGEAPVCQVATFSFEASEVACYGDERFSECCEGISALLERATSLLPAFAALHGSKKAGERDG
jgi:hypothetical protein